MKKEASIEKYLIQKCKEFDIFISKLPPSTRGIPDRILIKNGLVIFIELKKEGLDHTLNKQQELRINQINKQGAIAMIINNEKQIDKLVMKLASLNRNNDSVKEILNNAIQT